MITNDVKHFFSYLLAIHVFYSMNSIFLIPFSLPIFLFSLLPFSSWFIVLNIVYILVLVFSLCLSIWRAGGGIEQGKRQVHWVSVGFLRTWSMDLVVRRLVSLAQDDGQSKRHSFQDHNFWLEVDLETIHLLPASAKL